MYLRRLASVYLAIAVFLIPSILTNAGYASPTRAMLQTQTSYPQPVVAIHVSEVTQNLETTPASPPTPMGLGTTGYEWWTPDWRYAVAYESLMEAFRADGTPFVQVSDADIATGGLLSPDGSPKYPIVFSLASEAVQDDEIAPLRNYVASGGFLFVGSSSFTRYPDGRTRGDFTLAPEMGVHMYLRNLENWRRNQSFIKVVDHRLVSHIPSGTLLWRMPLNDEEIPWGISPNHSMHGHHYIWRVTASDAEVLANWGNGPLLMTKAYGQGRFIYHGSFQPLLGHGRPRPSGLHRRWTR